MSVKRRLFEAVEANDFEQVKSFIEKANVPLTSVNANLQTVAHIAARRNHVDILKYVLEKDSSILNQVDKYNNSPLHFASMKGSFEVVKYLVEEHHANITNLGGRNMDRTALHVAAEFNRIRVLKYFVEERSIDFNVPHIHQSQPPIFLAIRNEQWSVIEYLIEEKNADLLILNAKNETILFIVTGLGQATFLKYLLDEKKVRLDVNWKNVFGETILHMAAHMNRIYTMKYLVTKKHANVNAQTMINKRTPLHYAALHGHSLICEFLVDHGANVHLKDIFGFTALKLTKDENIIAYLEGVMHPSRSRRNVDGTGTFLLSSLQPEPLPSECNRRTILGSLPRTVECVGENHESDALTVSHLQGFLMLAKLTMKNLMQNERPESENIMTRYLSPVYVLRNRMSSIAIDVINEKFNFRI